MSCTARDLRFRVNLRCHAVQQPLLYASLMWLYFQWWFPGLPSKRTEAFLCPRTAMISMIGLQLLWGWRSMPTRTGVTLTWLWRLSMTKKFVRTWWRSWRPLARAWTCRTRHKLWIWLGSCCVCDGQIACSGDRASIARDDLALVSLLSPFLSSLHWSLQQEPRTECSERRDRKEVNEESKRRAMQRWSHGTSHEVGSGLCSCLLWTLPKH